MARKIDINLLKEALSVAGEASSDFDLNAPLKPSGRDLRQAGVLVGLIQRSHGLNLVLTKRASHLKHHPGQVAFPGGRRDDGDGSIIDTALREAEEEIGLPRAAVDVLGELAPHETVSQYAMTPVLGLIRDDFVVVPERGEVAEVFEVPADFVLNPDNFVVESRVWRGERRHFYTVPFGPYYIWGATARVLLGLANRVSAQ